MNVILFDDYRWEQLLPLTYTRPVAEIRMGIFTIAEKWANCLNEDISYLTKDYLSEKYSLTIAQENLFINGAVFPDKKLIEQIKGLRKGEALYHNGELLAVHLGKTEAKKFTPEANHQYVKVEAKANPFALNHTWDIFNNNAEQITKDIEFLKTLSEFEPIPDTVQVVNKDNIFIEKGAKISFSYMNASNGPIYIGKDAEVMEGAMLRGPIALCENSTFNMGAKIYGPVTIGPFCKVGGEVNTTVFFGFANKAHDGFLGHSVIGEWCNLGADTNNSNLKNNYAPVKLWDYKSGRFANTGLQFGGLIMGDHSKCGINTMFNTGTVVGVSANIFGDGFPRNFIPSFSWGGSQGFIEYKLNKVFEVADVVFKRRKKVFDNKEKAILSHIFKHTAQYRIK